MQPSKKAILKYYQARNVFKPKTLCYAPLTNLNFDQYGNVKSCCYTSDYVLGNISNQTIWEIWTGSRVQALRQALAQNKILKGCELCGEQIEAQNFEGSRAKGFDAFVGRKSVFSDWRKKMKPFNQFPKCLEFELSNTCNLACVMCNGKFSHLIRAHREKLPPLKNPYTTDFLKQLNTFLPHVTDLKFLGGEPFLIDMYYQILEKVAQNYPHIKIHITTNGSVLTKRVKQLLETLNISLIISIDSLEKNNYEQIRVNGSFEKLKQNLSYFLHYHETKNRTLSFAVCPMQQNILEMPNFLQFAFKNKIKLYFNTVVEPREVSLKHADTKFLEKAISTLQQPVFEPKTPLDKWNLKVYHDLINQLNLWLTENKMILAKQAKAFDKINSVINQVVLQANNQSYYQDLFRNNYVNFEAGLKVSERLSENIKGNQKAHLPTIIKIINCFTKGLHEQQLSEFENWIFENKLETHVTATLVVLSLHEIEMFLSNNHPISYFKKN